MANQKIIGYYGNGQVKYATDEQDYKSKGYSPSYNPNPFHSVDFSRKNSNTYYNNNGIYKNY